MIKLKLTASSQKDLRSIYQYSKINFGENQAFEYVHGLRKTIGLLKSNPYLGREDTILSRHFYRLVYRQNVIYYTVTDDQLTIRRILDARQDPLRHL
ncbi:MAG: hypothetical protein RIR97_1928 [Pseudomonadota bacterium]|jgi:toxin ParE1/3/4